MKNPRKATFAALAGYLKAQKPRHSPPPAEYEAPAPSESDKKIAAEMGRLFAENRRRAEAKHGMRSDERENL